MSENHVAKCEIRMKGRNNVLNVRKIGIKVKIVKNNAQSTKLSRKY
jgi:hypothetical protein